MKNINELYSELQSQKKDYISLIQKCKKIDEQIHHLIPNLIKEKIVKTFPEFEDCKISLGASKLDRSTAWTSQEMVNLMHSPEEIDSSDFCCSHCSIFGNPKPECYAMESVAKKLSNDRLKNGKMSKSGSIVVWADEDSWVDVDGNVSSIFETSPNDLALLFDDISKEIGVPVIIRQVKFLTEIRNRFNSSKPKSLLQEIRHFFQKQKTCG